MDEVAGFLARHGYALLFLWVGAEQIGLPIPAAPVLLAAGALAGAGRMRGIAALGVAVCAALVSDTIWHQLGRRRGAPVLRRLCRLSLEPDHCVRRTQDIFARHGVRALLVVKFVPGLNAVAAPLAGVTGVPLRRFLTFDALGALIWAGTFIGVGYVLSERLGPVVTAGERLGRVLGVLLVGGLAGYIGWKWQHRRRFLRGLRMARITPEALKAKLAAGEPVVIVDLRHPLDFDADPRVIPGAVHVSPEALERGGRELPRDREVVLYCT